jgi:chemotaxis-related protein WspD
LDKIKNNKKTGRGFLDRAIPSSFIDENTDKYAVERKNKTVSQSSFIVFRVKNTWVALKTKFFFESFEEKFIHLVPHRTNDIFAGLINIHGKLIMTINIASLINVVEENDKKSVKNAKRMLQIGNGKIKFVIKADEVIGNVHIENEKIEELPANIASAKNSIFKNRFIYNDKKVLIIGDDVFFEQIDKKLNW